MVVGLPLSVPVICTLKSRKPTFSTWYFEPLRVRKPRRCPHGSEKSREQGPAGPVLPHVALWLRSAARSPLAYSSGSHVCILRCRKRQVPDHSAEGTLPSTTWLLLAFVVIPSPLVPPPIPHPASLTPTALFLMKTDQCFLDAWVAQLVERPGS